MTVRAKSSFRLEQKYQPLPTTTSANITLPHPSLQKSRHWCPRPYPRHHHITTKIITTAPHMLVNIINIATTCIAHHPPYVTTHNRCRVLFITSPYIGPRLAGLLPPPPSFFLTAIATTTILLSHSQPSISPGFD
jgi:hypothetical protein